jgi:hypothetical protein
MEANGLGRITATEREGWFKATQRALSGVSWAGERRYGAKTVLIVGRGSPPSTRHSVGLSVGPESEASNLSFIFQLVNLN